MTNSKAFLKKMVLHEARTCWDAEVAEEEARLIEVGVPPYQAAIQAARNVSRDRARRTGHDTANLQD